MFSEIKTVVDGKELSLKSLNKINVILGRNGCGKSKLLRSVQNTIKMHRGVAHYIYPERGIRMGSSEMPNVDSENNNESIFFRRSVASQFKFETRKNIGKNGFDSFKNNYFNLINEILENVYLSIEVSPRSAGRYERVLVRNIHNIPTRANRSSTDIFLGKISDSTFCIAYYFDGEKWCSSEQVNLEGIGVFVDEDVEELVEEKIERIMAWFGISEVNIRYFSKADNVELSLQDLSSGENEILSLWMDFVRFLESEGASSNGKMLLIDEPDVHLHPDLQYKLGSFIRAFVFNFNERNVENMKFQVIIATHSTSFLAALLEYPEVTACFMRKNSDLEFVSFSNGFGITSNQTILKSILPIFGTHSLTQVFNEKPLLIVEGEDEERIWQQAVRTSKGGLKIYPCSTDGEPNMPPYEEFAARIIESVYDEPKAYSLRDKDNTPDNSLTMEPIGNLKRFKLRCRNSESLLLSDEVLRDHGITFKELTDQISIWIELEKKSPKPHPRLKEMQAFKEHGYDRRNFDLKRIRNLLLVLFESAINDKGLNKNGPVSINKPWEVIVGQVIGNLVLGNIKPMVGPDSIIGYLGHDFVKNIMPTLSLSPLDDPNLPNEFKYYYYLSTAKKEGLNLNTDKLSSKKAYSVKK